MNITPRKILALLLDNAPLVLLILIFVIFGILSSTFLTLSNLRNILVQSSSVAIVATGMTLVLLTGGIDLSVGSIMFLSACIAGKLIYGELLPGIAPISAHLAILLILPLGLIFGAINASFIAGLGMMPFVVTLATLFVGRGLGLQITETRAIHLPAEFLAIGQSSLLGIPFPILLLILVTLVAHVLLTQTPFGRQLYAMGNNPEAARKAGLSIGRLTAAVYILSGLCAAIGGIVSVAQLGSVSPTFGLQREFAAIAAAVLGGTSLFGGRGTVLPGALLGAVLIQSIESGLVIVNADPYIYPLITGATIFTAVLLDRLRARSAARVA